MSTDFTIKDSGARKEFAGGMVRDTEEGKIDYTSCLYGPMFERWMAHTTKGRDKYPDVDGKPNWTLGIGDPEVEARAIRSFMRHMMAYLRGAVDEDHAAAMFFNINVIEACKQHRADKALIERGADPDVFSESLKARVAEETEEIREDALRARASLERMRRSTTTAPQPPFPPNVYTV